jgi:transposase-like protein
MTDERYEAAEFEAAIKHTRLSERVADAVYDVLVEGYPIAYVAREFDMTRAQLHASVKRMRQELGREQVCVSVPPGMATVVRDFAKHLCEQNE